MALQLAQAIGAAAMRSGDARQPLREDAPRAARRRAAPAARSDHNHDPPPVARQIGKDPFVMAVPPARRAAAERARRLRRAGARHDGDALDLQADVIDDEARGMRGRRCLAMRRGGARPPRAPKTRKSLSSSDRSAWSPSNSRRRAGDSRRTRAAGPASRRAWPSAAGPPSRSAACASASPRWARNRRSSPMRASPFWGERGAWRRGMVIGHLLGLPSAGGIAGSVKPEAPCPRKRAAVRSRRALVPRGAADRGGRAHCRSFILPSA